MGDGAGTAVAVGVSVGDGAGVSDGVGVDVSVGDGTGTAVAVGVSVDVGVGTDSVGVGVVTGSGLCAGVCGASSHAASRRSAACKVVTIAALGCISPSLPAARVCGLALRVSRQVEAEALRIAIRLVAACETC